MSSSSTHKKQRTGKRHESSKENRFTSQKTEEFYRNSILPKSIISERGFETPGGDLYRQIEERGWKTFTNPSSGACVGLVREFYANALERRSDDTVFVRGKWVSFSSEAINQIYQLQDLEYDQYTPYRTSPVDYSQLLNFLCGARNEVQWKWASGTPTNFPAAGLNIISKAWHHFISARLLPSGHLSEVTRERALLNYAIQAGLSIDVGKIIYHSLQHTFQAKMPVSLGHPLVIHHLCVASDVRFDPSEEIVHVRAPIKGRIFSSSRLPTEPREGSPRAAAPQTPASRGKTLLQQISALTTGFQEHLSWHARQDKRDMRREKKEDYRAAQDTMYRQYMVDYHQASRGTTSAYPDPPRFSNYQEEEEEEEGGEEEEEEEEYDE